MPVGNTYMLSHITMLKIDNKKDSGNPFVHSNCSVISMLIKITVLVCAMAFPIFLLHAQTGTSDYSESIGRVVAQKGYENIRVTYRNDTIFLGLENRVWRWESRAVAEIFKLVMPGVDTNAVVSLTLLRTGIQLTTVIVSRKQYDNLLNGRMSAEVFADSVVAQSSDRGYRATVGHLKSTNRSFNKFDVIFIPQLLVQFGNFHHPLEIQFNVAPEVEITFLKGMSLTAQVIFPIYNNLIGDRQGNTIRPGLVVLSQTFRLPYQFFSSVSAGHFTRDRYGLSGEIVKLLFNGKMSVDATLGYTGQVQLLEGMFTYTPINVVTWFCNASWRFARYDLTIRAGYGGFIGRDQGFRVDVERQFNEVSIGFFAMRTGGVVNGGFNFTVPLPPRRYGTKNHIRVRPASYAPWEYRAKGLPSYGRSFTTGSGTGELLFNMNPDYIRTQLGKQIINY